MRRLKVVLPSLIAVLAAAALASASASAAQPEFYECAKLAKPYTGEYKNSSCSKVDPEHQGKYELHKAFSPTCIAVKKVKGGYTGSFDNDTCTEEDPNHEGGYELQTQGPISFSGQGSAGMTLYMRGVRGGEAKIQCNASEDDGTITGPTTVEVRIEFTHCERQPALQPGESNVRCSSSPDEEERPTGSTSTIVTEPLTGKLGYIDAETHEVGLKLSPINDEKLIAKFHCNEYGISERFRMFGSTVVNVTKDINEVSRSFELGVRPEYGQDVENLEGEQPMPVETEVFPGEAGPPVVVDSSLTIGDIHEVHEDPHLEVKA